MINRIYVIEYKFYFPAGGAFKYATKPDFELRRDIFTNEERDKFISTYQRLTSSTCELYVEDIKCYVMKNMEDITDRMDEVIGAI